MRSVKDDKVLFEDEAKSMNWEAFGSVECVSWGYVRRALFRVIDILHRTMLLSLFWIVCCSR